MKYRIVTPATSLAVSIAEAKTFCRVTSSEHDLLIESHIKTATQLVEQRANICIMPQVWNLSLDYTEVVERVVIDKYPILGFNSITYYDTDNAAQTLTNSQDDYISFVDGRPSSLIFDDVPTTYERDDAMVIQFYAGYGTVPEDLKTSIKMLVYRMYWHPDDPVTEKFSYVDKIVRDHRSWQ